MSEVNVFTDVGVLEWDMSTISSTMLDIENHLQFIRPIESDDLVCKLQMIVRDYDLQNDDDPMSGILYVIHATLLALEHYYGVSGKIFLHLRMERLNLNFKIRCAVYKESSFELIRRYEKLPCGKFKELMAELPQKLQEHFTIVIPSPRLSTLEKSTDALRLKIELPVVELRNDEGLLPIPPLYTNTISEMEKILQKEHVKRVYDAACDISRKFDKDKQT